MRGGLLDFDSGAAGLGNGLFSGSREGVSYDFELAAEGAVAKNLDGLLAIDHAGSDELGGCDLVEVAGCSYFFEIAEVHSLELNTVEGLETKLGKTTLERHLTTLEADLAGVARARLCTLVTAGRCAALTGAGTATDAGLCMHGACGRLEIA